MPGKDSSIQFPVIDNWHRSVPWRYRSGRYEATYLKPSTPELQRFVFHRRIGDRYEITHMEERSGYSEPQTVLVRLTRDQFRNAKVCEAAIRWQIKIAVDRDRAGMTRSKSVRKSAARRWS